MTMSTNKLSIVFAVTQLVLLVSYWSARHAQNRSRLKSRMASRENATNRVASIFQKPGPIPLMGVSMVMEAALCAEV